VSDALLSTKFYIPPVRANAISRPRLVDKLLAGVHRPASLTLLSGPAGFGKTTLLSELAGQLPRPAAWVSLDEGDNDPIRFWTYLIAACQSVQAGVGASALALFRAPQPFPDDAIPTILINDLARLPSRLVLILDDYHVIQQPALQAAFAFLLDHLPGTLSVVLSTRVDPPWPLARLRVRNQLTEVRAADLRFTPDEAAAFLNRMMGLNLPAEVVAALEARTEGWIAGLQLAALALQAPLAPQAAVSATPSPIDSASFVQAFSGSHVFVAEYLMEEVLQRQPQAVQTFLLQTALLERMTAGLCEAVTGGQDSQAMLAALHRANLFLVPLDDEARWFRYHHLFADLLQARLRQTQSADALAGLHRRAAAWYAENGFAVDAIHHALAARDFETAAQLMEQAVPAVMTRGELATVLHWAAVVPAETSRQYPALIIAQAWALTLAGAARQVEALLQQVESYLETVGPTPAGADLLGNAAAIRAFFAMLMGDDARALALAERADTLLSESSIQARSLLPYILGSAYRAQGQYDKAVAAFVQVAQMGEAHGVLLSWATGITEVVNVRRLQGRLREAGEVGRLAEEKLAAQGVLGLGPVVKVVVAFCEVLREQNDLEAAQQRMAEVLANLQTWDMPTDRLFAYLTQTRLHEAQGNLAAAQEMLQQAQTLKAAHPVLLNLARLVDFYEIRLALAAHDTAAAARLVEGRPPGQRSSVLLHDQELIMLARVRLAQARCDEALAILAPLSGETEAGGRRVVWLESLILLAQARDALGDRAGALAALLKALALAEPEGFVRLFLDEGEKLQMLLAAVAHQLAADPAAGVLQAYTTKLLGAFPPATSPAVAPPAVTEVDGLFEPLTPRELEVLQRIAAGDSNQAIAAALVISVSAVKKHTGNIFGKLHVSRRTQAVARARQLGLLTADA
jgi:LuxR family transcriptional regulator, maltose regulon positive regulatory protein